MPAAEVRDQREIAPDIFALTVAPAAAGIECEPGQFLHLRVPGGWEHVLRRPLSICRADEVDRTWTVVYRAQGDGTRKLSQLQAGDTVDALGPLGRGYPLVAPGAHALLVGGGIGVPPLVLLARRLTERGVRCSVVAGYATREQAVLTSELSAHAALQVVTEDGSLGARGRVTDALAPELLKTVDHVYACGPTPMLQAVQSVLVAQRIPGHLSLEERMGCGFGLCAGCVHRIRVGVGTPGETVRMVKTCREGPVFAALDVVFP